MFGGGFVHGLGGLRFSFGGVGLPRARRPNSSARAANAGEESLGKEASVSGQNKWQFPVTAGLTSGTLAFVGDGIAQFHSRYQRSQSKQSLSSRKSIVKDDTFWHHDWVRAVRMASYGFLLYGPISHWWYELLDYKMPAKTLQNFSLKVLLNQIVLGPIIVSVVFAWNCAWQGRLEALPDMYRYQAFNTLADGWKFWTPVSFLNFGVVPLKWRVGFMSTCAICWNYYLSTVVSPSQG